MSDFIQAPSENEYIDENATLGEATHQLIVQPYLSLLVTSGDEVVGILRLSDVESGLIQGTEVILKNVKL